MVTRSKMRKALTLALDEKDPMADGKNRGTINWPMKNFRHAVYDLADEFPQIQSVAWEFTSEQIGKQLTTCVLKTDTRTARLTYDYRTDSIEFFCIGKDLDAVRKVISVSEVAENIREFFPVKKRVMVVRKRA